MGFGNIGTSIIKNNRNLLPQRDHFNTTYVGYFGSGKAEFIFPEPTPMILREIRWRLRSEHELRFKKIYIVFSVIMLMLIYGLVYLNNNFNLLF